MLIELFKRSGGGSSAKRLENLTRLIRRFCIEQQQVPKELVELVRHKYLEALPPAPDGQRFVIDRQRVEVRLEPLEAAPKADGPRSKP